MSKSKYLSDIGQNMIVEHVFDHVQIAVGTTEAFFKGLYGLIDQAIGCALALQHKQLLDAFESHLDETVRYVMARERTQGMERVQTRSDN